MTSALSQWDLHNSHHSRESKKVLDSGFHTVDFEIQVLDFGFIVSGTWITDFKAQEFRIPQAKIYRILDYLTKNGSNHFDHNAGSVSNWITLHNAGIIPTHFCAA